MISLVLDIHHIISHYKKVLPEFKNAWKLSPSILSSKLEAFQHNANVSSRTLDDMQNLENLSHFFELFRVSEKTNKSFAHIIPLYLAVGEDFKSDTLLKFTSKILVSDDYDRRLISKVESYCKSFPALLCERLILKSHLKNEDPIDLWMKNYQTSFKDLWAKLLALISFEMNTSKLIFVKEELSSFLDSITL